MKCIDLPMCIFTGDC